MKFPNYLLFLTILYMIIDVNLWQYKSVNANENITIKNQNTAKMSLLKKIAGKAKTKGNLLKSLIKPYLEFKPENKEIILTPKMVLFLCQQVEAKSDKIKSLKPAEEKGLIAEIKYQDFDVTLHFTPKSITLKEDTIEGELELLKKPDIKSDHLVYKTLIAGWQVFLGGKIPDSKLPENVTLEGDRVFYKLPRQQATILLLLLNNIQSDSTLNMNLEQGALTINTDIALDLENINLQDFLSILNKLSVTEK